MSRPMPSESSFYVDLIERLDVRAVADQPLSELTTMKVGGPADWVFFPGCVEQAAKLAGCLAEGPLPVRFLGAGSNVIVADEGIRAVVIATSALRENPRRVDDERIDVLAGAGVPGLVRWAAVHGLSGVEFAEGIPAKLGGAVRMNAGANGKWFSEVIESVRVVGPDGKLVERKTSASDFSYRDSFVAREKLLVLGATLKLEQGDPVAIRDRIRGYRTRRRDTQPLWERSAGCVFANWPEAPVGKLVEELGLKGTRVGGAEVSTLHGNFIINRGGARARDVLELIEQIRDRLGAEVGSHPRLEVEIWRDSP